MISPSANSWKRTFAIIWTGQLVSIVSSSIVNFAVILWLSIETRSAEVLAFAAIAGLLPQSVLGLFSGALVDRWDRKTVMICSDGFIALCTLAMSLLFYFGTVELWHLYVLLGLRSVGSAFHMPAMQASVPLLAPESELLRIAGVNQALYSVSYIAGPALGAVAIGLFDIGTVVLIDVVGAAAAIASLLMVHIPNPERAASVVPNILEEIRVGITTVIDDQGLRYLFLYSVVAMFCIMPISVLFPLMTLDHFGGGIFEMSLIEVIWSVGMLLGGAALGLVRVSYNKALLLNGMYLVLGAALAMSGMLPSRGFVYFVLLTAVSGMAAAVYQAAFAAIIQERVDVALLGRVFSMYGSISILPSLLGLLGTGFLADSVGVAAAFVILGTAVLLVGVLSFLTPSIRPLGLPKPRVAAEKATTGEAEKAEE